MCARVKKAVKWHTWHRNVKLQLRHVADVSDVDVALAKLFVASSGATVRRLIVLRCQLVTQLVTLVECQAGSLRVRHLLSLLLMRGPMLRAPDADVVVLCEMVAAAPGMAEWWMISVMVDFVLPVHVMIVPLAATWQEPPVNLHQAAAARHPAFAAFISREQW